MILVTIVSGRSKKGKVINISLEILREIVLHLYFTFLHFCPMTSIVKQQEPSQLLK